MLTKTRATRFVSSTGVVVAARISREPVRNRGKSAPVVVAGTHRQRQTRKGGCRLMQMADGSVLPMKPGNAGLGKGP